MASRMGAFAANTSLSKLAIWSLCAFWAPCVVADVAPGVGLTTQANVGNVACSEHGNCETCSGTTGWSFGCRWCPLDQRCHVIGSPYNSCNASTSITNTSNCPASGLPKTTFDLQVAYDMARYADAAYEDVPSTQTLPSSFKITAIFNSSLGTWNTAFGYMGFDDVARRVVLAFRGTNTFTQVTEELLHHSLVEFPGVPGALVNEFFLSAISSLNANFSASLNHTFDACPGCTLFFTGHSLGGSLAMLSAYSLRDELPRNGHVPVHVYTFGQPRVGNVALAKDVDRKLPSFFRLVNAADVVPHIPGCDANKSTFDQPCAQSSRGYFHGGTEIWFPSGDYKNAVMCGYRECIRTPQNEDITCSDGLFSTAYPPSIADHHGYFDVVSKGFCGEQRTLALALGSLLI